MKEISITILDGDEKRELKLESGTPLSRLVSQDPDTAGGRDTGIDAEKSLHTGFPPDLRRSGSVRVLSRDSP